MRLLQTFTFLGTIWALPVVPFPWIPTHSFLSTMVKVDQVNVVLENENIGGSNVTVHEATNMNDV
jgi:hypothetical protein